MQKNKINYIHYSLDLMLCLVCIMLSVILYGLVGC